MRWLALALLLFAGVAHADDEDTELYARVIVDSTMLRSGPGATFRSVYLAHRGEIFPVRERATRGGYWFRVELPDGTSGWVLGETVYNLEVGEEEATEGRFLPGLFAPPPLPGATGELAVTFGLLGSGGMMAVRPTFYIEPALGIEATAAASVSSGGRLFFGTIGGLVNLFPRSPIVPYLVVGGGVAFSDPNADTFLLESGSTGVFYGGGGLRIGFRYRITLRFDVRAYAFHEADRYVAQEELSCGLTVFF